MTLTLPDLAPTNTWFGRSQYTNDPFFNGQLGSVHVYGRVLSASEIVAPQALISAPPTGTHYQPGGTIQFAGTATDYADNPLPVSGLTWTVEFCDTNLTNVVLAYRLESAGEVTPFLPVDRKPRTAFIASCSWLPTLSAAWRQILWMCFRPGELRLDGILSVQRQCCRYQRPVQWHAPERGNHSRRFHSRSRVEPQRRLAVRQPPCRSWCPAHGSRLGQMGRWQLLAAHF